MKTYTVILVYAEVEDDPCVRMFIATSRRRAHLPPSWQPSPQAPETCGGWAAS